MFKDPKKYLFDIAEAIMLIFEEHLQGINSLEAYKTNRTVQAAVERQLITIGEAVHKLKRLGVQIPYADNLINRRNTLTHQYDVFSASAVWNSVHSELPHLKTEVEQLLLET